MSGIDELIERLLYDIALSGNNGFSAQQFEAVVRHHYDEKIANADPNDQPNEEDLLFSSAPPVKKINVDEQLLESIFDWLHQHPDVEIVDVDEPQGQVQPQSISPILASKLAGKRIIVSEDRVWQAIAGHGIDNKRIPQLEFAILSVIAAHGPNGILQPHVVKLTGQDKRSVPKRTDCLAEKGYIIKEDFLGAGSKTSNLKLKRYATEKPLVSIQPAGLESGRAPNNGRRVVHYEAWFNTMMQLLKENENIIALEDLRLHLGLNPKFQDKILRHCIRRIEETGCVRFIFARLHDADGNPLIYAASGKERKAQSIQLLREPTDFDRIKWVHGNLKGKHVDNVPGNEDDDAGEDDPDAPGEEDEDYLMATDDGPDDLDLLQDRIPPQWTPDMPIVNLVYQLVEESGPEGMSTMDIANRLTGPAWRRPLDQVLLLLTDAWQHSQPPHLRHLSIVRDSAVRGKYAHFRFRTHDNFQKAVDAGQTTWEAALGSRKGKGKKKPLDQQPNLDDWGFPIIPLKELEGYDGRVAMPRSSTKEKRPGATPANDRDDVYVTNEDSTLLDLQQDEDDQSENGVGRNESQAKVSALAGRAKQTAGIKRRGPYKRREDPSNPGVPLTKKRDIPQREFDEWEAAAEATAQRKVLFELHASKKRTANEAGNNGREASLIAVEDLPQERVDQVKEEILAREKPGIYINPPGARSMKQENFVSRGRPRKALIAVVKTTNLLNLEWFQEEGAPRFAPAPSRKRTAKTGLIPAEPKSPEFVDSDSEPDEPARKKQRLNEAGAESVGRNEDVPAPDAPSTTALNATSQPASASGPVTSAPDVTESLGTNLAHSGLVIQSTPEQLVQHDYGSGEINRPATTDQNTALEPTSSLPESQSQSQQNMGSMPLVQSQSQQDFDDAATPTGVPTLAAVASAAATQGLSAVVQLEALKSRRGRRSKETIARMAELERQIHAEQPDSVKQFKAPKPKPSRKSQQANPRETEPQRVAEPVREVGTMQNESVIPSPAAAPIQQTPSSAEEQLKILKSKPGRKSQKDTERMAELQRQIEAEQSAKEAEQGSVIPAPAAVPVSPQTTAGRAAGTKVDSAPSGAPPKGSSSVSTQRLGSGNFTASNGKLIELFDKEYVAAHPSETFHHRGQGRYARGPRPPSDAPRKDPSLVPTQRNETGNFTAGSDTLTELFDKEYVAAHPNEAFHHRGQGRYARGPRPPRPVTTIQPVQKLPDQVTVSAAPSQTIPSPTIPPQLPEASSKGPSSDERNAGSQDVPESDVEPAVTSPPRRGRPRGQTQSTGIASQSVKSQKSSLETFSVEYVDQHPDETFHHKGRGRWLRGLPAPGSDIRIAVRGPDADAWRASIGLAGKPARTSVQKSKPLASTKEERRASKRNDSAQNKPDNDRKVASGRIVKLRISPPNLAALGAGVQDLPLNRRSARKTIPSAKAASLMTRQGLDTAMGMNAATPGSSGFEATQARPSSISGSSASALPSLLIIKPYSSPTRKDTSVLSTQQQAAPIEPATPRAPSQNHVVSTSPPVEDQTRTTRENQDYTPAIDDSMDVDEPMVDAPALNVAPAASVPSSGSPPKQSNKSDVARSAGNVAAQRHKIIFDALRACDGVFPGNAELWYVFVAAWKRIYNQTPDKNTIDNTIKALLQRKKLKKLQFQFRGKRGQVVQRAILTEPDVDPKSLAVKKVQKKIIDCYPNSYLPAEVEVNDDMRAKMGVNFREPETLQAESVDDLLVLEPMEHQSAAIDDEPVVVRQTQEASALETEQAKQLGFPDAATYRKHLLDEVAAKKVASNAKAYAKSREAIKWGEKEYTEKPPVGPIEVRKVPPPLATPSLFRRPLGSLRPSRTKKNSRRPRDVQGAMTLEDEARHQLRAASLVQHPTQNFHEASGTFGTSSLVPGEHEPELRTLRNRAVVLDEYDEQGFVGNSSSVRQDLAEILNNTRNLEQVDMAQDFFEDDEVVENSDEQPEDREEVAGDDEPTFVDDTLDQAHVDEAAQQSETALPEPPAATPSLTAPKTTAKSGKPKRKYTSRKRKSVTFDEGAHESDSEYVPGPPSPEIKPASVRADGKEIVGRDRTSSAEFKDIQRLIVAIALVTTICGGINPDRLAWNIVAHAMSFKYDGNFYRRRWDLFKRYRAGEVDGLRRQIREELPKAYENDELPRVDFQNLSATDWPAMVAWAEEVIVPNRTHSERPKVADLLQSRGATEEQFVLHETTPAFRFNRDEYFTNITDTGRKHFALKYTHGIPHPDSNKDSADDMAVLRSWVRAVTMTKQWNYNAEAAAAKIRGSFSNRMLEKATSEMLESRMLAQERKGRHLPGRNFTIHGDVLFQFRRWPAKPEEHLYLRQIASVWSDIAKHFAGNDRLELVAEASDPEYIVLSNMASQGLIKTIAMLPPRKDDFDAPFPKLSPWGYGGASYETKRVNPSILKAPIVYVKTSTYQSHHGLAIGVPIPLQPALMAGETGLRIPFWVDIHGNLIDDVWDMVVRSIINILVFRSGSTSSSMQEFHGHKFWEWEIEMVLEWMEKIGIAKRCGPGVEENGVWKGGWTAGEWWYCAFAADVAVWQPPSGAEVGDEETD